MRIEKAGEETIEVGCPRRSAKVDPTGVGDAFRAGFLSGLAWGVSMERAAQVGCMLATLVIETLGTQEYELRRAPFMDRFARPTATTPPPRWSPTWACKGARHEAAVASAPVPSGRDRGRLLLNAPLAGPPHRIDRAPVGALLGPHVLVPCVKHQAGMSTADLRPRRRRAR